MGREREIQTERENEGIRKLSILYVNKTVGWS